MKTINIKCESNKFLKLEEMHDFQGELKDLMEIDYQKLKKSIKVNGFISPFNVWFYEEKWYLLDGHQRHRTLTKMKSEGFDIPDLPVTVVHADSYKQAKAIVLSLTSQYGTMTPQGLYEFMSTADLDFNILNDFRLPEINMDKFAEEFGDLPKIGEGDAKSEKSEPPKVDEQFIVSIECEDESQMQEVFEEMKDRGFKCKLIT